MSADALPTDPSSADAVQTAVPVGPRAAGAGICRNCGASAPGTYCPSCGQETDTRLPTLRQFMREATGRLIAFDGRLWRTLFALVARPGLLTREYFDGRRRRYIRPTRLFLVMSVILFGVLRLTTSPLVLDDTIIRIDEPGKPRTSAASPTPRAAPPNAQAPGSPAQPMEIAVGEGFGISLDQDLNFVVKGSHNLFSDELRARLERFNRLPRAEKGEQISAGMLRYGPYAMFALLPAFAWLQQISYLGRARRYPGRPRRYVEHLVYAAHMHTFLFLAAIVALLVPWTWLRWVIAAGVIYYISRAKREIYRGSRLGGLVRGAFVFITYTILFLLSIVALIFPAILLR